MGTGAILEQQRQGTHLTVLLVMLFTTYSEDRYCMTGQKI